MSNKHLTHLEDLPLTDGKSGAQEAVEHLIKVFEALKNNSADNSDSVMTVKYDGAPAIFIGNDPEDGKFFVAKKSVLNKTPKVYKTEQDIKNDTAGDLAVKMIAVLNAMSGAKIKDGFMYQGDLMFTVNDLVVKKIDGTDYVTFQPNTIMYAYELDLPETAKIAKAKIGVVFHTMYKLGKTLKDIEETKFSADIAKELDLPSSVYLFSPSYTDATGVINLPADLSTKIEREIGNLKTISSKLDSKVLDEIASNKKVQAAFLGFMNFLVKTKVSADKFDVEMFSDFMNRSKTATDALKTEILKFIDDNTVAVAGLFEFIFRVADAKNVIVKFMNTTVKSNKHFLELRSGGFEVSTPEGYVAFKNGGGAVKFVDRLGFSAANFDIDDKYVKGFEKNT